VGRRVSGHETLELGYQELAELPRAALYHRVSTLDQDPTAARWELEQRARAQMLNVVLSIEETGSGARSDRPGLQRLLEAARRGELDVVLCWKLDRFGRSALDLLGNIEQLLSCGVRFVATSQGIDLKPGGDAMSRLLVTMLAAVAEFERDLIRDRTKLGMQKARAAGVHVGRPRGPRPPAAAVAELRARGLSWKMVAEELGFPVSACRRALSPPSRLR
jgi:DNA invertase Pin-like site-specific DNA recombinase